MRISFSPPSSTWWQLPFENGELTFVQPGPDGKEIQAGKIAAVGLKLANKNEVVAELMNPASS